MAADQLFFSKYHPTRILWTELSGEDKAQLKYLFALQVLAYLRDHPVLPLSKCDRMAGDIGLGLEDWNDVCEEMWDEGLLIEMNRQRGYRLLNTKIYKRLR